MKPWSLLLCCLPIAPSAHAIDKADFAFGYTLQVAGDGAIYAVDLSADIYRGLVRSDRGDLRVFNSAGVTVPHYIRRAEHRSKQQVPDVNVPLFPLYEASGAAVTADGLNVHIATDAKGAVVDIKYANGAPDQQHLRAYLLDASQLEHPPNVLLLHWPEATADFVATLQVEHSNDLSVWRSLVNAGTLSNLHYAGHTLVQQRIELPTTDYKYLRLRWQGNQAIELNQVIAQFPEHLQAQERQWTNVDATRSGQEQGYYYFATGAVLPVDRLNIALPQRNTLAQVRIESAASDQGPWQRRYDGLVYDLQFADQRLMTPDILLDATTHGHWRLRFTSAEGQPTAPPQLRLGWIAEQLLFVAQGIPPFVLAYGSGRVTSVDTPLPMLLRMAEGAPDQLVQQAHLGQRMALGDASNLQPVTPPTDWKRYGLWSILALGVILLAWMALRLYREMEPQQP